LRERDPILKKPQRKSMKIESWPVGKLIPYARNARTIPPEAVAKVAASLAEFGWQQPIVIDSEGVVVAGHVRLLAAKQLEMEEVPVSVAAQLTPGQIKAFRLMDNRSHEETGWDMELLALEMAELQPLDVDPALTGFDAGEIAKFLAPAADGQPPGEFNEYDESIPTEHRCPKCGYTWSGKPAPAKPEEAKAD
jgi:hypothetical protein